MTYRVVRHARTFAVVDRKNVVVEGGFFSRDAADDACDALNAPTRDALTWGDVDPDELELARSFDGFPSFTR